MAAVVMSAVLLGGAVVAKDRSEVPEKYTWDLKDLYPSVAAWKEAKGKVLVRMGEIGAFKGKLGDSAGSLYGGLLTLMEVKKETVRLFVYAMQLCDQDTRVAENSALRQEADQLMTTLAAASSFVEPEILALDRSKVEGFLKAEPKLVPYRPYLDDILRRKSHTRSPEVEKVLAQASSMALAPDNIYSTFTGADLPYPEVTLSTGEKVRLDVSGYARHRGSAVREDRIKVFQSFWKAMSAFEGTFGQGLYGHISTHIFNRDARNYASCLDAALDENAIPTAVYTRLVEDVHANLPTLHRYLSLRKRMMGVDSLRYEDLYAPIVKEMEAAYTPEQAAALTMEALAPLGEPYVAVLKKGFDERWVDWYPSPGKRSGAYCEGAAYDVHPYQLLNFNGAYDDVSTLAHESGHAMHYYLSNKKQPYVTSEHATFVAEVASTLNESLLFRYSLNRAKTDEERLFLLGERLDGFRTTLFRQTLFAEFELRIHEMAEKGEPVTGEALHKLYLDLVRTYYGHDRGLCSVDDLYGAEWTFIHHFYYNFYVYQYATSLAASTYISRMMREERAVEPPQTKARDAYMRLLSAGCSKYPIDLLKDAGVDMTTSAPFKAAMDEMNEIMGQMEAILGKRKG
jgi:oligoendopeptidase F